MKRIIAISSLLLLGIITLVGIALIVIYKDTNYRMLDLGTYLLGGVVFILFAVWLIFRSR
jgi:Mn2+/Fe2+ NRAMP family transporter